jgi:uncharacterized protein YmfQ (DUF2313 family)
MSCYQYEPKNTALATLQRHLPTGLAWDAYRIVGKNAYKLWSAFAQAYENMSQSLCQLALELNPYTTVAMIEDWERAVGLPDACLPPATTLAERRGLVLFRLAKKRYTTAAEYVELAQLFGLQIVVTPGWHVQEPALYAFDYPKKYDLFPKLGRFRVYIDILNVDFGGYSYGLTASPGFPVPYNLPSTGADTFKCLIDRIRPANVVVIWNENPLRNCYTGAFSEEFSDTFCSVNV